MAFGEDACQANQASGNDYNSGNRDGRRHVYQRRTAKLPSKVETDEAPACNERTGLDEVDNCLPRRTFSMLGLNRTDDYDSGCHMEGILQSMIEKNPSLTEGFRDMKLFSELDLRINSGEADLKRTNSVYDSGLDSGIYMNSGNSSFLLSDERTSKPDSGRLPVVPELPAAGPTLRHFGTVSTGTSSGGAKPKIIAQRNTSFVQEKEKYIYSLPIEKYFEQDEDGDNPFIMAFILGKRPLVFHIIELVKTKKKSTFLNLQNRFYFQTVLHLATSEGDDEVVRALLIAGASRSTQDHNGNTALHIACKKGSIKLFRTMVEAITAADETEKFTRNMWSLMKIKNFSGLTCLHVAAKGGYFELVEYMVTSHLQVDINLPEGTNGRTILHMAVQYKDLCLAMFIVRWHGTIVDAKTLDGHTALRLAAGYRYKDMRDLLISAGADYNLMYEDEEEEIKKEKEIGLYTDDEEDSDDDL